MVLQKIICWTNLGCAPWCVVCHCQSVIHSEAGTGSSCTAMTHHYPTTSAAAAVCSGHLSPFLLASHLRILLITCQGIKYKKLSCRRETALQGGWWVMAWVRQHCASNVVGARKLKALIFYTINPLLYEKRPLCVLGPFLGA